MYPPEEVMLDIFIPSFRALVAHELSRKGYSQSKISKLLGVTQARVSMYLNSKVETYYSNLLSLGLREERVKNEVKVISDLLVMSGQSATEYIIELWQGLLASGSVCNTHVSMYPQLKGCDICMRIYSIHADEKSILLEVERCVKILESSQYFPNVIPEVAANIARSKERAESKADVVAVPGRIVRVGNFARASSKPEFGASKHLSLILIEAKRKDQKINSVINIKFDEKIDKILKELSLKRVEIGGEYPEGEDRVAEAFRREVSRVKEGFDVLVDRGGKGVEPNLYIFGKDAYEATEKALKIAELYSKGLA